MVEPMWVLLFWLLLAALVYAAVYWAVRNGVRDGLAAAEERNRADPPSR